MPPFNTSDLYSAQSATGNGSFPANATNRELDPLQHLYMPALMPVQLAMPSVKKSPGKAHIGQSWLAC